MPFPHYYIPSPILHIYYWNPLTNTNFCFFRAQVKEEPEEIEAQESEESLTELGRIEK